MARDESQTAKAIKIMREIKPGFNVHELEADAKGNHRYLGIFELAYISYLNDDLSTL
jgi:mitochondrial import inner membrane translocase subunit TIM44